MLASLVCPCRQPIGEALPLHLHKQGVQYDTRQTSLQEMTQNIARTTFLMLDAAVNLPQYKAMPAWAGLPSNTCLTQQL